MKHLFLGVSLVALCAMQTPDPGPKDQNTRIVQYDQDQPVKLVVDVGRQVTITFSDKERVKNMMFGQDDGPAYGPNTKDQQAPLPIHSVPVWGGKKGITNLTVITIALDDFTERTYKFVVFVKEWDRPDDIDPEATYWLRFTYSARDMAAGSPAPAGIPLAPRETPRQRKEREQKDAQIAMMATDVTVGRRYGRYVLVGDASIAPYDILDNTRITGFVYHPNTLIPTPYVVDTPPHCDLTHPPPADYLKAPERTAPSYTKGAMLVVQESDQHFRFRLGNGSDGKVLDIFNCGYDAVGDSLGAR